MSNREIKAKEFLVALLNKTDVCGVQKFETKRAGNGDLHVTGYASVFNTFDTHNDYMERGAFSEALNYHKSVGTMPAMFMMHDYLAGRAGVWESCAEDDRGLLVKGRILSNEPQGRRAINRIECKDLKGFSIGFKALKFRKYEKGRFLEKVALAEISIVDRPSNHEALIGSVGVAEEKTILPPLTRTSPILRPAMGFEYR
jgi:HK97 family phage prohead protease